ncbi:DUF6114 domain-containing protein [Nonomuraea aurantiaca]|uniref:DUF6114 domain-containing protein n=1 Tax=Nonomuraea aurantiaca TaxID=2878562 RepID=UPI001CD9FC9B|nr:DUF6114 domain-containing protein [Nonomuraea aurantiaca]MCA2229721.1 DUF6114 domain-containing protein [Nonomuraea aurantiaca]
MTFAALRRFHSWRHGRPFSAGLLTIVAGVEILLAPVIGVGLIIQTGFAGQLGFLLGIVLIGLGLLFWTVPTHRAFTALFTIAVALAAFLTTNLGGFLVGHLLALTGAATGIAWMPAPDTEDTREQAPRPDGDTPR